MRTLITLTLFLGWQAFGAGGTGADSLLDTLGTKGGDKDILAEAQGVQLKDPFAIQFFSLWQSEPKLTYEMNAWAAKVLKANPAEAAHLWMQVYPCLEAVQEAKAAYLRSCQRHVAETERRERFNNGDAEVHAVARALVTDRWPLDQGAPEIL